MHVYDDGYAYTLLTIKRRPMCIVDDYVVALLVIR